MNYKFDKKEFSKTINKFAKNFFKSSFIFPIFISPFLILFYKFYLKKVSAFGCFDDCFNIVGGYFLTKGKTLYTDIFFNHQPFMAYISSYLQIIFDPINIFELILIHRKFIFIFSILMNFLISARFRIAGIGFVLFYEVTKFYVFGDRFLAEAIIVYPLVYLFGIVWYKLNNKKLHKIEYILAAFFTWFIIFLREPFIPLAIFLFIIIIHDRKLTKTMFISILILILLISYSFSQIPLVDYIFNVFTINKNVVINKEDIFSIEILKIIFYPFYIFFDGKWSNFRIILMSLSSLFITFYILLIIKTKKWKMLGIVAIVLSLANIRYVTPGQVFYESFHIAPWYGMFIFIIFIFFQSLWNAQIIKKLKYLFIFMLTAIFLFMLLPGKSFIWEKTYQHAEFITNYGIYLSYGEASRILSFPNATFFVDGFDELIYWQAKLPSIYKYSWYTSVMPHIDIYSQARTEMFKINPPDIYYGSCPKETVISRLIPKQSKELYLNLYAYGKPTCLYLKKENINKISKNQWQKVKEFGFYIP